MVCLAEGVYRRDRDQVDQLVLCIWPSRERRLIMDVKEKLVELLDRFVYDEWYGNGDIAEKLISNGVTVQKWISVDDRLPENGKESVLIALRWGEVDIGWCEDGRWRSEFINEYEEGEVTHWMPIPQPPKGVNDGESVN